MSDKEKYARPTGKLILLGLLTLTAAIGLAFLLVQMRRPSATFSVAPALQDALFTSEEPQWGGVYRTGLRRNPSTLDPARITDVYSTMVAQQIFDGLLRYDPKLRVRPALAEHWELSDAGNTWTFRLRQGVKFHHGREVTAEDWVYSITRLFKLGKQAAYPQVFKHIEGVDGFISGKSDSISGLRAEGKYLLHITLTEPRAAFLNSLTRVNIKVVPREIVEDEGEQFAKRPVGTGPFKLASWQQGERIVLTSNNEYYLGRPFLDRVVFQIFPKGSIDAMFAAFQEDALEESMIPSSQRDQVIQQEGERYKVVSRPLLSTRFLVLNTRLAPFDDVYVRRALLRAIDRREISTSAFSSRYPAAYGMLPPGMLGFNPELARKSSYDMVVARELIKKSKYHGNIPHIDFWSTSSSAALKKEDELLQRYFQELGLTVQFNHLKSWKELKTKMNKGEAQMFRYSWTADIPDPDDVLFPLFFSKSKTNRSFYNNPEVDRLLTEARRMLDNTKRVELYQKLNQLLVSEAPMIPLHNYVYERAFRTHVRTASVTGLGGPYLEMRSFWLKKK